MYQCNDCNVTFPQNKGQCPVCNKTNIKQIAYNDNRPTFSEKAGNFFANAAILLIVLTIAGGILYGIFEFNYEQVVIKAQSTCTVSPCTILVTQVSDNREKDWIYLDPEKARQFKEGDITWAYENKLHYR